MRLFQQAAVRAVALLRVGGDQLPERALRDLKRLAAVALDRDQPLLTLGRLCQNDFCLHLRQGDVVVQCGTRHAWRNKSDKPAIMLFVLVDGWSLIMGSLAGSFAMP